MCRILLATCRCVWTMTMPMAKAATRRTEMRTLLTRPPPVSRAKWFLLRECCRCRCWSIEYHANTRCSFIDLNRYCQPAATGGHLLCIHIGMSCFRKLPLTPVSNRVWLVLTPIEHGTQSGFFCAHISSSDALLCSVITKSEVVVMPASLIQSICNIFFLFPQTILAHRLPDTLVSLSLSCRLLCVDSVLSSVIIIIARAPVFVYMVFV